MGGLFRDIFPPKCDFKCADGTECPVPASHFWGPVKGCCTHFEEFALSLLRLDKLPHDAKHIDIVEEYNRQCGRTSVIPGTKCESND